MQQEQQATITGTREQLITELRLMADRLEEGKHEAAWYVDAATYSGDKLALNLEVDDSEDSPPCVEFERVPA